jgi:hypothetical protein
MDANNVAVEATPSAAVEIPKDEKAYAEWRQTGKLPEAKAKPAKDDSDSASGSDAGDKPGQKSAPAPEAGKETQEKTKTRSNAQIRLDELLEDLKSAGLSPSELKTFKREAVKTEQARETPEPTVKLPERPRRPKRADFYDKDDPDEAYEAAMDTYEEEVRKFDRQEAVAEFQRLQAEENTTKELTAKLATAKKRYGDEAGSTIISTVGKILGDNKIPGAIKAIINDSPVLVDLLHVIGSKPADLQEFIDLAHSSPGQAIRKAILLERLVMEELEKGTGKGEKAEPEKEETGDEETPERDDKGKFVSPKKITKAPPPPEEVGGSKGAPPDEVEAAAKAKDFASFRSAANRRDLARAKGM